MAIKESAFENEAELHDWVSENLTAFLPVAGCFAALGTGRRIAPDGRPRTGH